MQNGLVPVPLISESIEPDESSEIDFGKRKGCEQPLEESEFAIGNICDDCRPDFEAHEEARFQAEQEEAAERIMFPEESDDDWEEKRRWRSI